MISEFWITSRVGPENSRSRPRSMVTLATTATSTAGSTAITENRLTIWTCSLAAARPRRLRWSFRRGDAVTAYVRRGRTDPFISQCCRIATIPRRIIPAKNIHPQRIGDSPTDWEARDGGMLAAAPVDLDVEVADLLA